MKVRQTANADHTHKVWCCDEEEKEQWLVADIRSGGKFLFISVDKGELNISRVEWNNREEEGEDSGERRQWMVQDLQEMGGRAAARRWKAHICSDQRDDGKMRCGQSRWRAVTWESVHLVTSIFPVEKQVRQSADTEDCGFEIITQEYEIINILHILK